VLVLVASGVMWFLYRDFSTKVDRVNAIGATHDDVDGRDTNILLVGSDDRTNATPAELKELSTTEQVTNSTDTMILVHIPADGRKATAVSFPRDSWVTIPGCSGQHKLNSAYINGATDCGTTKADPDRGRQKLVETISELSGLKIDHYVEVDLLGFYRITKAIGGVQVCLNQAAEGPVLGHRPAQGRLDDRGQAGAGVRPAAARAAPRRPGPDRAPAVLHVGGVPEGHQPRHADQPDQAEAAARRGRQLDADGRRPRPDPARRPAARAGRRQRHVHHDPDRGQRRPQRPGRDPRRRLGDPAVLRVGDQPAEAEGRGQAGPARRRDRDRLQRQRQVGPGRAGRERAHQGRLQGRRHRQRGPAGLPPHRDPVRRRRRGRGAARCSRWIPSATLVQRDGVSGVQLVLGSDFSSIGASTPSKAPAASGSPKASADARTAADTSCIN
jgi:LCP family protein required for cell wall assembly